MKAGQNIALFLLIALALHAPAMFYPDGASHSGVYNLIWTTQFGDALQSGDLYPRWFFDSFEGLGSPTFYFYPPLAYWASGAFAALGISPTLATVFAATAFSAGSGLAMYWWLAPQTPHARLAAIAYMAAPYHLYDFYVRGALAEYASFMWPPLIIMAMNDLPRPRSLVFLALSYAGLLITHLPAALLATVFLIIPFGIYKVLQNRKIFLPGIAAGILGVGIASFYLLPAMQLQYTISTDLLWSDYYRPQTWFPWNRVYFSYLIGVPALALSLIVCGAAVRNYWGIKTSILAAASIGLIPFIWDISLLAQVQFPWRLLGIVEFAVITAIVLGPRSMRVLRIGLMIAILPIAAFTITAVYTLRLPLNVDAINQNRPDAPEYLPPGIDKKGITGTQRTPDLTAYRHLTRNAQINVTVPGRVVMGRADFPIWQVMHNGQEIAHRGPLIEFHATDPGLYSIERKVLPSELIGGVISLLALIAMMLFSAFALASRSKANLAVGLVA